MRGGDNMNVVVIMADQLRWDCLGLSGNPDVRTPNLDALADDGTWFDNAFCPAPVCAPSRYSLLTGLYPHQHLGISNRSTLAQGFETFPKVLRGLGYHTTAVGKMHLTPTYLDVGFDRLFLAEQDGDGRFDDDYHRELSQRGMIDLVDLYDQRSEYRSRAPGSYWESFGAEPSNLPEEWYSTTWIGDRAVGEVEKWDGGRELLFVSFIKPHHPFDVPERWSAMYDPVLLTLLEGWMQAVPETDTALDSGYFPHKDLTEAKLRRVMAGYYGSISHIDEQVGRLISSLRRRGLYDDTLIVFTGDHGEYLGYHHMLGKGNHMYEPLARVPLILKLPGQRSGPSRRSDLVSLVDVAPTVVAQVGGSLSDVVGTDLAGGAVEGREAIFAESRKEYMVRTHEAKLLVGSMGQQLLFDLNDDPLETTDLSADRAYAKMVEHHRGLLDGWLMWESAARSYRSDSEPLAKADNVPGSVSEQQALSRAYFERAFQMEMAEQ